MSLTVPRGPVIGGVAASPRVEATETGAAFANLGDRMFEVGMRIAQEREQRALGQAKTATMKWLNDTQLQAQAIGDPDELDSWASTEFQRGRQAIVDAAPQAVRDQVGQMVDDMATPHMGRMGQRALDLRQSQEVANLSVMGEELARAAATGDAQIMASSRAQMDEHLQGLVTRGVLMPDAAERQRQNWDVQVQQSRATSILGVGDAASAQAFLDQADAGEFDLLPSDDIARLRVQAERNIASEERQRQADIGKRLGEIADIANDGRVAVDEEFLTSPEVQANPGYAKAAAAISLRKEVADLPWRTVAQLDQLIAEEKARPIDAPWRNDRLAALIQYRDEAATGWKSDPIGFAAAKGMQVPALPEFDPADPGAFAGAIADRVGFVGALRAEGYANTNVPLSIDEQAHLKRQLDVGAPPAERAALAKAIVEGTRANPSAADAVLADPVLRHVGGLLATTRNRDGVAAEILTGQQVMAHQGIDMPALKDRVGTVFDQVGALFLDMEAGAQQQQSIIAATDALYAARRGRVDPAGDYDSATYAQALHEVLGGTGSVTDGGMLFDGRSDNATGGVATINGRPTILPVGVRSQDVSQGLRVLRRNLSGRAGDGAPVATGHNQVEKARGALSAASGGGLPMWRGADLDADDMDSVELIAIGDDRYTMVVTERGARVRPVDSRTGDAFEFSLKTLLRELGL